jgi:hypothetical protein
MPVLCGLQRAWVRAICARRSGTTPQGCHARGCSQPWDCVPALPSTCVGLTCSAGANLGTQVVLGVGPVGALSEPWSGGFTPTGGKSGSCRIPVRKDAARQASSSSGSPGGQ